MLIILAACLKWVHFIYSLCYFICIFLPKHFSSFSLFLEHNLNSLPGPMKPSRPLLASVSSSCMGLIPHFLHHHCREGNNLFSPLLHCWLRTPIIKRQFNRQKTNKFNNTYTSCTHGRTQEKLISSQKGPSHHLKYHLQLKTKKKKDVGVEASHARVSGTAGEEGHSWGAGVSVWLPDW